MNTILNLRPRPVSYGPAIEWEELPSLADRLARNSEFQNSSRFAWDATMPATLEFMPEPEFKEPISGLSTRELREPDVFRHFFASAA